MGLSQQLQKRKFQPCGQKTGTGCGKPITFDARYKSANKKFIPLEQDVLGNLIPHDCEVKKPVRGKDNPPLSNHLKLQIKTLQNAPRAK